MRKRLVLTISILPLIFIFLSSLKVYAEESRLDKANRWLLENNIIPIERYPYFRELNYNRKPLYESEYLEGTRDTIVYGQPHDDPGEKPVQVAGGLRHRYLGYTMSDAPFTNYMYPDDNNIAESYWSRGYNPSTLIFNPWERTATANHKAVSTTTGNSAYAGFSGNPEFEGFIREGLRIRSRHNMAKAGVEVSYATVDFTDEQITSVQWHQYAYIIQPPTRYSWGSAVLFRNTGTGIGYLTIPLPNVKYNEEWPEDTGTIKADLKVTNVTPSRLIEGERRDVTITLNSGGSVATLNGEPAGITARRY